MTSASSYSYIAVVPVIVPTKFILKDCENNEIIESIINEPSAGFIIRGPADCTALIGGKVTLTAYYDAKSDNYDGLQPRWLKAVIIIHLNITKNKMKINLYKLLNEFI